MNKDLTMKPPAETSYLKPNSSLHKTNFYCLKENKTLLLKITNIVNMFLFHCPNYSIHGFLKIRLQIIPKFLVLSTIEEWRPQFSDHNHGSYVGLELLLLLAVLPTLFLYEQYVMLDWLQSFPSLWEHC